MTIISTAKEPREFDFPLEETTKSAPSFPPVDDAINYVKSIDWADVRKRARHGLNNVGLVIAVVGEKIHDAGAFLANI